MNSSNDLISIIIVTKHDRVDLTLDHLQAIKSNVPFEVIVVDASRPERTAAIRTQHDKWVTWDQFPFSTERTTPAQRNRGLELAKGNIIVFLDANCVPAQGWLDAMWQSIQSGKQIVCGPVLDLGENNLVHYAPTLSEGKYVDVCTTINVGLRR